MGGMDISEEIQLPANILLPDAPGSGLAALTLELHVRLPMPDDPTVHRKIPLADLIAQAELVDVGVDLKGPRDWARENSHLISENHRLRDEIARLSG